MSRKFTKNNQSFTCVNCGHEVPEHPTSSRDHCNNCLYSMHVDVNPGDRKNNCRGLLEPIGIENKKGRERIVYRCHNCKKIIYNIVAEDDNIEEIEILYALPWKNQDN